MATAELSKALNILYQVLTHPRISLSLTKQSQSLLKGYIYCFEYVWRKILSFRH